VTLRSGEALALRPARDLGERNPGILVFVEGRERPEFVRWADVARVDFEPPPAMDPPTVSATEGSEATLGAPGSH
jgi:hypothetical protein